MEQIPLLNEVLPTSWGETETIPENIVLTTTTPITTTRTMLIASVSISSTPQVSSTGLEEGTCTFGPICLPEEDPQIPCPVCDVIDCMIHNPRHRYCMNCGQRLLGPHACPNEIEHPEPPMVQHPTPQVTTGPIEQEQRRAHLPEDPQLLLFEDTDGESIREMVLCGAHMLNMDLVTRPVPPIQPPTLSPRSSQIELPMYVEAITSDQGITTCARIAPGTQNVLHHVDYSSDPEEARIHFELASPTRRVRSRERYERHLRRSRRRDSPNNGGISHFHYYQGDINVEQPPLMTKTTQMPRSHVETRQTPRGGDGSSPGDEDDSSPRRGNSGRDQPPDHQRSKTP